MNTINLSGAAVPGGNLPSRNHHLECFLRPFENEQGRFLDAQVHPNTAIDLGDQVFYRAFDQRGYEILNVKEVVERRPAKGNWEGIGVHMDWIRIKVN